MRIIILIFLFASSVCAQGQGYKNSTGQNWGTVGYSNSYSDLGYDGGDRPPVQNYNAIEIVALNNYPGVLATAISSAYGTIFSTRKTWSGATVCLRIRRSSDDTEQDIGFSGNDIDNAAIVTFLGGSTGYVAKWYDQSGNGNHGTQSTFITRQALYRATGFNSKPDLLFDGVDDMFDIATANTLNPAQITLVWAVNVASLTNFKGLLFKTTSSSWNDGYGTHVNGTGLTFWISGYNTNYVASTISINTNYVVTQRYNQVNVSQWINGGSVTNDPYTTAITSTTGKLALNSAAHVSGNIGSGKVAELILVRTGLSDSDLSLLRTFTNGYYSVY